jgi:hypothetical protein
MQQLGPLAGMAATALDRTGTAAPSGRLRSLKGCTLQYSTTLERTVQYSTAQHTIIHYSSTILYFRSSEYTLAYDTSLELGHT